MEHLNTVVSALQSIKKKLVAVAQNRRDEPVEEVTVDKNVFFLTPKSVPEFHIPRRSPKFRTPSPRGLGTSASNTSIASLSITSATDSSDEECDNTTGVETEKPPDSPSPSPPNKPFQTNNKYGFLVLSELPHTRRRESIFHTALTSGQLQTIQQKAAIPEICEKPEVPPSPSPERRGRSLRRRRSSRRRLVDTRGLLPAAISPLAVTLSPLSLPLTENSAHPLGGKRGRVRSLTNAEHELPLNLSRTRSSTVHQGPVCQIEDDNDLLSSIRRRSLSPFMPRQRSITTSACPVDVTPESDDNGERFLGDVTLQATHDTQQQKLTIKALTYNLDPDDAELSPPHWVFRLGLAPGKAQKQSSQPVPYNATNTTLSDVFAFTVETSDIFRDKTRLRLKVVGRWGKGKADRVFAEGEKSLPVSIIGSHSLLKLKLHLPVKEELGYLRLGLQFVPNIETLHVSIGEARKVPAKGIFGAQEVYVRVLLKQPSKAPEKQTSKILKLSPEVTFNEHMSFQVSPRIGDIKHTSVTVSIATHQRVFSDRVLGQVRFGVGATEDLEISHWQRSLQNPGACLSLWHALMEND